MDSKKGERLLAGLDIGGTKLYTLVTTPEGKILGSGRKKTKGEQGFDTVMERAARCVGKACEDAGVELEDLDAVGVGAPSPILADGTAVNAPNLQWFDVPLVSRLEDLLKRPVFAENDCNAGTLGEYALGAGRGAQTLVGYFMGTGLGGGIVSRGDLIRGENRQASELGHMIVQVDGRRCGCGHNGCVEAYASKTGMGRRFALEIVHQGRASALADLCDGDYANIKSSVLATAYRDGDALTIEVLHEAARYLGIAVAGMITALGPDTVVIGGGVFEALGKELIGRVREAAKSATHPPPSYKDTKIVLASLADDAVALGAMVHARESLARTAGSNDREGRE